MPRNSHGIPARLVLWYCGHTEVIDVKRSESSERVKRRIVEAFAKHKDVPPFDTDDISWELLISEDE